MATHSSVLAWRTPGTEEPGGCRLWGRTELDTTEVTWQHPLPPGTAFNYTLIKNQEFLMCGPQNLCGVRANHVVLQQTVQVILMHMFK